jgi:3-phenylpropionate/trans-cinnamate dioxygenase ferredoxin subunit
VTAQRACSLAELLPDTAVKASVDGEDVALVRVGDEIYAIRDECSHAEVALSDGDVEGCEIECFLHGSRFDLRTGKPVTFPATEAVLVYPVTVDGDDVYVDIANPLN